MCRRRAAECAEGSQDWQSAAACWINLGNDLQVTGRFAEATDALQRMEDSLSQTNSLKLSDLRLRVGRMLRLDAKAETCNGDADANRLLTRENRRPFVVS